ncbi:MAG TPA: hypothetical protein VMM13_02090 [Euzebya sp.]|nr:hypothetical protein [Euzebya sp.]
MHMEYLYIQALLEDRRREAAEHRLRTSRQRGAVASLVTTRGIRPVLDSLLRRLSARLPRVSSALDKA